MDSVRQVFPIPVVSQTAVPVDESVELHDIGVLVGITGDYYGNMILKGDRATFGKLGESMYGMPLEGEMLHSFAGELANMIAGCTSTIVCGKGRQVDITPPTVMVGKLSLFGNCRGIAVPIDLENVGNLGLVLTLQHEGAA